MPRNNRIYVWVTKEQKEKILEDSKKFGFLSVASYVRFLFLNENLIIKINDLLKKFKTILENERKNKK